MIIANERKKESCLIPQTKAVEFTSAGSSPDYELLLAALPHVRSGDKIGVT